MALIYKGTVDSLVQQVGKYKDRINERYQQVLGDENYKKLESIAQRVLVPESFFNTYEELQRFTRENIPIETPSKFMILTDSSLTVDESGKIKEKKARAGFGFYINEESFKYSGSSHISEKIIASYIHEFDHFVYGALQKTPMYLVRNTIVKQLGYGPVQLENLNEYLFKIEKEKSPLEIRKNKGILAIQSYIMEEMWENSTRILDKLILESIGITVSLPFRNKERRYGMNYFEGLNSIIQIPLEGDLFRGLGDNEVVHRVIKWDEYMNLIGTCAKRDYLINFWESLKQIQFEVDSIPEIERLNQEEWREHRQSKQYKKKQELHNKLKKRKKRK